ANPDDSKICASGRILRYSRARGFVCRWICWIELYLLMISTCMPTNGRERIRRHLTTGSVVIVAMLIGRQAAVAEQSVVDAARDRDVATIRTLLTRHADVNKPQGDGATALHWAAHWDDGQLAEMLIRAGARPNTADEHGVTPLALACLNASSTMVKMLLAAGANPNTSTVVGETPLMVAAHTGNVEVIRMLLDKGADLSAVESSAGQPALMRAVAENHADVAKLLIERGAKATARSKNEFTPLLFAAQQGNIEIAQMLVTAGADVNETAPDGISGDTNSLR